MARPLTSGSRATAAIALQQSCEQRGQHRQVRPGENRQLVGGGLLEETRLGSGLRPPSCLSARHRHLLGLRADSPPPRPPLDLLTSPPELAASPAARAALRSVLLARSRPHRTSRPAPRGLGPTPPLPCSTRRPR